MRRKSKKKKKSFIVVLLIVIFMLLAAGALLFCLFKKPGILGGAGGAEGDSGEEVRLSHILDGSYTDVTVSRQEDALAALDAMGVYYGFENAEDVFESGYVQDTGLFTAWHFSQTYEELDVVGHGVNVIVDDDGTVLNYAGNYANIEGLETDPAVDEASAVKAAFGSDIPENYTAELCVYVSDETPYLAWEIVGYTTEYFVDAGTGKVIAQVELAVEDEAGSAAGNENGSAAAAEQDAAGQDTDAASGSSQDASEADSADGAESDSADTADMRQSVTVQATGQNAAAGTVSINVTYDSSDQTYIMMDQTKTMRVYDNQCYFENSFSYSDMLAEDSVAALNDSAVDALYNLSRSYDFFSTLFGHKSVDGFGEASIGIIVDLAQIYDKDGNLTAFIDNAFSSTSIVFNSTLFAFSISTKGYDNAYYLDVVSHEYTHAVQKYIIGADSYSTSEGAAVDEAIADILAECCGAYYGTAIDWYHTSCGTGRSISDPTGNCITKYEEYKDSLDEHDASTLISHVAYCMYYGGYGDESDSSFSAYAITDYRTIAKLWYNALYLMDPDSGFSECRDAVVRTAELMNEAGELTDAQYIGVLWSFEQSGIPGTTGIYLVDEESEIQVEVIDYNSSALLKIPYEECFVTVTTVDGRIVTQEEAESSTLKVKDIIDDNEENYVYYVTYDDSNSDRSETILIEALWRMPTYTWYQALGTKLFPDSVENIEVLTNFGSRSWITGKVTDEAGNSLEGSQVTLTNGGRQASVQTGGNGTYSFFLYNENQNYTLAFSGSGYEDKEEEMPVVSEEDRITKRTDDFFLWYQVDDITLESLMTEVSGTVTSLATSEPLANATLTVTRDGEETPAYTVSTDAEGNWSVMLEKEQYTVTISCENYETLSSVWEYETIKDGTAVYDYQLEKSPFLQKLEELTEAYGIFNPDQTGTMNGYEDMWLDPSGVMSANILDFDLDGETEMLICLTEKTDAVGNGSYKIMMSMWEQKDGEALEADRVQFLSYLPAENVKVELPEADWQYQTLEMNVLPMENSCYLICEADLTNPAFISGEWYGCWILTYADEAFSYVGSFAQDEYMAFCDFSYTVYELTAGQLTGRSLYYEGYFSNFEKALGQELTGFFSRYGITLVNDPAAVLLDDSQTSILSEEIEKELVFCFTNRRTNGDGELFVEDDPTSWNTSWRAVLTRGNDYLTQ